MPMADKPVRWVGTSLEDLRAFPEVARREAGYQLRRVEHRVFYVAKFEEAIYVLHAFEKRTRQTRQADLELARRRLADVIRARRDK
jgi:phage-related protein